MKKKPQTRQELERHLKKEERALNIRLNPKWLRSFGTNSWPPADHQMLVKALCSAADSLEIAYREIDRLRKLGKEK